MKKIATILMVAFQVAAGCASSQIELSKTELVPQNEGIVFGRVKVISDGKIINLTSLFGESTFGVLVLPDDSSNIVYCPLKDDGSFYWHLAPGNYVIAGFEWQRGGLLKGRIFAHFTVLEASVSYIGTLKIVFTGNQYIKVIEDEYNVAIIAFKKKFPEIQAEITKKLLKMEEER